MRVLLNTHIWLRALTDAASIPAPLRARLGSSRDTFLISAAGAWEIAQTQVEGLATIAVDPAFRVYRVPLLTS